MRKHFLILMLLALLPLASWALTAATLRNAPTRISGLRYNGTAQNLITAITDADYQPDYQINQGGVKFVVKTTNEGLTPDEKANATTNLPQGINSGMYYIHYQVLGDGVTYSDGEWTALGGVFINKGLITNVSAPVGYSGLIYDGGEHALLKTAASCSDSEGAITYKIGTSDWKNAINDEVFTKTDANDYVISWKVAETENWEAYESTITVSINPLSIGDVVAATGFTVTLDNASLTKTYTGSEIDDITVDNVTVSHSTIGNLTKTTDFTITLHNATNVPAADATNDQKPYVLVSGAGNYGGSVRKYFTINPKNISSDITVDDLAAVTYTGEKILASAVSTTGKVKFGTITMTEGDEDGYNDYTIETGDDFTVATGGTITITGHGNYTGTKTANFAISKATLKVTPAAGQAKNLGSANPTTYHFTTVDGYGLLGQDAPAAEQTIEQKVNALITNAGTITVTRAAGESAGTFLLNVALSATAPVFANYSIEAVNEPQVFFTINRAGVTITATPAEQTFGYTVPDITDNKEAFAFTATGLIGGEAITNLSYDVTKKNTETAFVEGNRLVVATYVVTPKDATATSNSYEFEYVSGEFQVVKKVIYAVAQAKTTNYNKDKTQIVDIDLAKDAREVESVFTTWSDDKVKLCSDEEGTVAFDPAAYAEIITGDNTYENWKFYLLNTLTWDKNATTIANPGTIQIGLKEYDTDNFDVQVVPGTVTWADGVGTGIDLVRFDINEYTPNTTVSEAIEEYNGATTRFTLKAKESTSIDAFRKITANRWYALVLPFNTSVREISRAFGYAVVDIFNEESSNTTNVSFKLHVGDINANEPFIFKVDQDIDLYNNPVNFNGIQIVYDADPSVSAAEGKVKFIGSYDGKKGFTGHEYVFSLTNGGISGTSATTYLVPGAAYIHMDEQMDGMNNAPIFNIEEPDGSTTSISAVDFAKNGSAMSNAGWYTVNGVKLNAAPTEKGVYINNGKKVVLK